MSRRIGWAVAALMGVALVVGAVLVITTLLREPPSQPVGSLARPAPGEVRPDYLADGTPVWVVGYGGDAVGVVSAISTHRPGNLGMMLWWCATAEQFQDPAFGSAYDLEGFKIGGPAPTGLPVYEVTLVGSTVHVGELRPGPPPGTGSNSGPRVPDRDQCFMPDDPAISFHTFEGWTGYDSPTDAVASGAAGWILVVGEVVLAGNDAMLCAIDDCSDAVLVADLDPGRASPERSPIVGERFIARVRDGALVDLTRVVVTEPPR